jgi:hypothetical protein
MGFLLQRKGADCRQTCAANDACVEREFIVPKEKLPIAGPSLLLWTLGAVHVRAGAEEDFGGFHYRL